VPRSRTTMVQRSSLPHRPPRRAPRGPAGSRRSQPTSRVGPGLGIGALGSKGACEDCSEGLPHRIGTRAGAGRHPPGAAPACLKIAVGLPKPRGSPGVHAPPTRPRPCRFPRMSLPMPTTGSTCPATGAGSGRAGAGAARRFPALTKRSGRFIVHGTLLGPRRTAPCCRSTEPRP
jgi:hypothetical protein